MGWSQFSEWLWEIVTAPWRQREDLPQPTSPEPKIAHFCRWCCFHVQERSHKKRRLEIGDVSLFFLHTNLKVFPLPLPSNFGIPFMSFGMTWILCCELIFKLEDCAVITFGELELLLDDLPIQYPVMKKRYSP